MVSEPIVYASLGVGLSVFLSVIGASIGISISAPAIAAAGTERPEIVSKSLIATILAEALAIYGLVVGLLSIFKLPTAGGARPAKESGLRLFFLGSLLGGACVTARFVIGNPGGG